MEEVSPLRSRTLCGIPGTLVMVLFLEGVVAQVTLSDRTYGSYLSINIVTGIAVMLGMLIAGPVTGAHLNPAITFAFVVFRRFPLRKVPGLIISQLLAHKAAVIFSTYPSHILPNLVSYSPSFWLHLY